MLTPTTHTPRTRPHTHVPNPGLRVPGRCTLFLDRLAAFPPCQHLAAAARTSLRLPTLPTHTLPPLAPTAPAPPPHPHTTHTPRSAGVTVGVGPTHTYLTHTHTHLHTPTHIRTPHTLHCTHHHATSSYTAHTFTHTHAQSPYFPPSAASNLPSLSQACPYTLTCLPCLSLLMSSVSLFGFLSCLLPPLAPTLSSTSLSLPFSSCGQVGLL